MYFCDESGFYMDVTESIAKALKTEGVEYLIGFPSNPLLDRDAAEAARRWGLNRTSGFEVEFFSKENAERQSRSRNFVDGIRHIILVAPGDDAVFSRFLEGWQV